MEIWIGRAIVMEMWRQIDMVMMIRIGMEMRGRGSMSAIENGKVLGIGSYGGEEDYYDRREMEIHGIWIERENLAYLFLK
jgi:hypothetical protein